MSSHEHESWSDLRDRRLAEDPDRAAAIRAESRLAFELGNRVRELRELRGWTQAQLAEAAGMRQPHVARFELGGTIPTLTVLQRLALALGAELHVTLDAA